MNYLLDTCVISELVKPAPNIRGVVFVCHYDW
jgi:predicted nucleic acid-binding protein